MFVATCRHSSNDQFTLQLLSVLLHCFNSLCNLHSLVQIISRDGIFEVSNSLQTCTEEIKVYVNIEGKVYTMIQLDFGTLDQKVVRLIMKS